MCSSMDARCATDDGLAELVSKHPDRFIAFAASLPMNNVDASLDEMTRAIDRLGAKDAFDVLTTNDVAIGVGDRPHTHLIDHRLAGPDAVGQFFDALAEERGA